MLSVAVGVFMALWFLAIAVVVVSPMASIPLLVVVLATVYAVTVGRPAVGLLLDIWQHGIRNDR